MFFPQPDATWIKPLDEILPTSLHDFLETQVMDDQFADNHRQAWVARPGPLRRFVRGDHTHQSFVVYCQEKPTSPQVLFDNLSQPVWHHRAEIEFGIIEAHQMDWHTSRHRLRKASRRAAQRAAVEGRFTAVEDQESHPSPSHSARGGIAAGTPHGLYGEST